MASILVLDDDPDCLSMLDASLRMGGHETRLAERAYEAIRLHQAHPFDLLLTDILMPEMDGFSLIQHIRTRDGRIRIVALSGGGLVDFALYERTGQEAGANAVLRKPMLPDDLLSHIDKVLAVAP